MLDTDDRPRIPLRGLEWGVIFSILTSVFATIFSGGIVFAQVKDSQARIAKLEGKAEDVPERLASIESKLEFLVDQYRDEKTGR